jgi:hypothetical protein
MAIHPTDSAFPTEKGAAGLSQRDYVAICALQGLLAEPNVEGPPMKIAAMAYSFADALIAASTKATKEG